MEIETETGQRLQVKHEIVAPGNAFVGPRWRTTIFLVQGSSRYNLGSIDGKLSEDEVKVYIGEHMQQEHDRQYGQQTTLLRRELSPRRKTHSEKLDAATLRSRINLPIR